MRKLSPGNPSHQQAHLPSQLSLPLRKDFLLDRRPGGEAEPRCVPVHAGSCGLSAVLSTPARRPLPTFRAAACARSRLASSAPSSPGLWPRAAVPLASLAARWALPAIVGGRALPCRSRASEPTGRRRRRRARLVPEACEAAWRLRELLAGVH
ncbi:Hypothetical predicted protein [Podarcis lilfordi]|uniref:Uncharacterized protein n=1 Tax=Podarcis lilfordi TaxID=74358 RepID=A0AA35KDR6_9SAUR|nr:Hypothetical predicted protein [Podarcis lilfordi]